MHGKLKRGIQIGGTEVFHETLVANISYKFILSVDFLMAHYRTIMREREAYISE